MEKMVPAAVCSGIPDGHAGADLTGGGGWGVRPSAGPVPPGPDAETSGEKRAVRDRGGGCDGQRAARREGTFSSGGGPGVDPENRGRNGLASGEGRPPRGVGPLRRRGRGDSEQASRCPYRAAPAQGGRNTGRRSPRAVSVRLGDL